VPPLVDNQHACRRARGGAFLAPVELDWLDAYARELRTAKSPLDLLDRMPMAAE
jgi:hypothetical protein